MDTQSELGGSVCTDGHPLTAEQRFCPTCGSAAQSEVARSRHGANGDAKTSAPNTAKAAGGLHTPTPANWANDFRMTRLSKRTLLIVVGIIVVAGLAVALVLTVGSHGTTGSLSYRDGYVSGRQAYANDQSPGTSPDLDCTQAWVSGPAINGSNDNQDQWYQGCDAGWYAASKAASYNDQHPGANT